MATKEMIIVFVYDTQLIQNEEDDPATAILYFHPTWVSDQQKTALCGQLMGVFHCLKGILKRPRIIALQSGKFFVREYGRYLLATGTDRNIVDWLLEHRANILQSLISFYHKGIEDLSLLYQTTENLSAKLYHMFETYLKVLFLGGNTFTHIPILKLPKSASNVFLEAIHILQCCQKNKCVLGGTLLYHNKVVATQLSSDYTKRIVITDPYRIKAPAEVFTVGYDLPLGVQLLEVYIDNDEYQRLLEESTRSRSIFQYLMDKSITKPAKPAPPTKEPVISAMKRDQSLLFTAVLEEDADHSQVVEEPIVPMRNVTRPKFLNLKNKTTDTYAAVEGKEAIRSVAGTPLHGQTTSSICSTPLTDLSKLVHSTPLSICTSLVPNNKSHLPPVQDCANDASYCDNSVTKDAEAETSDEICTSLHSDSFMKTIPFVQVANNLYDKKRWFSMSDLSEKLNSVDETESKDTDDGGEVSSTTGPDRYKTIADPLFPIFKYNGLPASYFYYTDAVAEHAETVKKDLGTRDKLEKTVEVTNEKKDVPEVNSVVNLKKTVTMRNNIANNSGSQDVNSSKEITRDRRKSLTLPLKSLSLDGSGGGEPVSPVTRRLSAGVGVQLTPLMSKLSTLDFDERASSGFGSRVTTPGEFAAFTPGHGLPPALKYRPADHRTRQQRNGEQHRWEMRKCVMFVFGQQDTVAVILLQEDVRHAEQVVSSLFDICSEYLGKLEKQLCHCLETYPNGNLQNESEPYSYLCLDPDWDTLQRGGPWTVTELGALTQLHRDFLTNTNLVEILSRGSESVMYGYHLGDTEVFYHQGAAGNAGLPTPADAMGHLPLKARRRLERDHGVILL